MGKFIRRLYVWLVYLFFYFPLFAVFVYSFNSSKYTSNWTGFTFRWYKLLSENSAIIDAAINSVLVAVCAASMATFVGSLAAICVKRYRFIGRRSMFASLLLLTLSPDIVMGISLLIIFIAFKVPLGFTTLFLAHTTLCTPFVALTVLARLSEFDEHLIEAARDLGASEVQAFRYVLFPLTLPAIAAGWLLSFTLSMDDVLISTFVTGPAFEVLPVKIYSLVKLGVKPDVNALSAIMFALTLITVFSAQFLLQVKKK